VELKPCPFCGLDLARLACPPENGAYRVKCEYPGCYCRTTTWVKKQDAIKAWNKRAKEEWK